MTSVRISTIILFMLFIVFLVVLLTYSEALYNAHVDESIMYLSSDGFVYFSLYETSYRHSDTVEDWSVFLISSPTFLMMLTKGNLLLVQTINLVLMFVTLRVALNSFDTFRGRMTCLLGALIFPYFVLGFLSLNKEIYAMCAAIFYASYMRQGSLWHLLAAFALALAARYYMVASLLMLLFSGSRRGQPRWSLIVGALLAVSIVAPMVKALIPQYSHENLLDNSGTTAVVLDSIVNSYGYFFIYPVKYVLLLVTRPYSYIIGSTHDAIGALVSLWSLAAISVVTWIVLSGERLEPVVKRLIVAGLVAPIPMMWSEIMHWRYYSYVFFFFLFAIVLQRECRVGTARRNRALSLSTMPPLLHS